MSNTLGQDRRSQLQYCGKGITIASLYGVKEILILVRSPHSSNCHGKFWINFTKEGPPFLFFFYLYQPQCQIRLALWFLPLLSREYFIHLSGEPTFSHLFCCQATSASIILSILVCVQEEAPLMCLEAGRRIVQELGFCLFSSRMISYLQFKLFCQFHSSQSLHYFIHA